MKLDIGVYIKTRPAADVAILEKHLENRGGVCYPVQEINEEDKVADHTIEAAYQPLWDLLEEIWEEHDLEHTGFERDHKISASYGKNTLHISDDAWHTFKRIAYHVGIDPYEKDKVH